MSNSNSSIFLRIVFIIFMTPYFSFAKRLASFDSLPPEVVGMIFQKLPQIDQKNTRLVGKKCNEIATSYIKNIKLSGQISDDDFPVFEKFIKNLRNIEIKFLQKPSEDVLKLLSGLHVKVLQLQEIDTQGIWDLLSHLPANLQELNLRKNSLKDADAQALAKNLPATLQRLVLPDNNIGAAGAQALAEKLPAILQQLYLSGNKIGDAGAQALAKKLPAALQQLYLCWGNIGDAGAQALAEKLPANLRVLWLSGNDSISDAGAQALAKNLPATLEEFHFRNQKITDVGLADLLVAAKGTNLEKMTISVPEDSPLREQFKNLRNQQGHPVTVIFE